MHPPISQVFMAKKTGDKYIKTLETEQTSFKFSLLFFVILISKVLRILSDSQNSTLFYFYLKMGNNGSTADPEAKRRNAEINKQLR